MKKLSKILLMVGSVCMINTASFAADPPKATIAPKCMCIKAPCNCPDMPKKPLISPKKAPLSKTTTPVPDQKVAPTTSGVPK
ncbi:MAG: hypothetical protein Q8L85_07900 [Alphaproteobacteria bacterium]|nr:hypothetical protein [Alphaproteobacteria bacterium]